MRISKEVATQLARSTSLAFMPQHLVSAAHDGTVALLNLESLEVILLTSVPLGSVLMHQNWRCLPVPCFVLFKSAIVLLAMASSRAYRQYMCRPSAAKGCAADRDSPAGVMQEATCSAGRRVCLQRMRREQRTSTPSSRFGCIWILFTQRLQWVCKRLCSTASWL